MRAFGRMLAMGAAAAAVVVGGATVAHAQTEAEHTTTCATEDACIKLMNITRHNGYQVSDVWYRDPDTTCAPEWDCAYGWQFQWWD